MEILRRRTWTSTVIVLSGYLLSQHVMADAFAASCAFTLESYTCTTIDVPGATLTEAFGINDAGQIVGSFGDATGAHGFLRDPDGTFRPNLFVLERSGTAAFGINNAGQIVGSLGNQIGDQGFLLDPGRSFTPIDVPGAIFTEAFGINNAGQIVGRWFSVPGQDLGFLRGTAGGFATIGVRGATATRARGINDAGQIVGSFGDATGDHGFLRDTAGGFTTIDVPGTTKTRALRINNAGQIVGFFGDATGEHGFLRDTAGGITTIDVRGATGTFALGINDAGQIVGIFADATGFHGFLATPCQVSVTRTASGHNWSMKYSACGKDGLVLTDVKLGSRLLARRMSLPYYTVLDQTGIALARCELQFSGDAGTPCGSQLRNGTVFVHDTGTSLVLSASYDIDALPGFPDTRLTIVQHYEFHEEAGATCEPSGTLPCARWQPIVLYQFVPPSGQVFQGGINTVQRLEFDVEGAGANAAALFKDVTFPRRIVHILPPEFSVVTAPFGNPMPLEERVVAIRNGGEGKVDNFHQTSHPQIDEPTFSLSGRGPGHAFFPPFVSTSPGCPECAHIHWRWGKAVEFVDPTFFGANGEGNPIIRPGSNQDVEVAVTLLHPGEEHPQDYTTLINGESLLGGAPVFWYSAFGHQPADTFFLHGGFFVSQP